MIARQPAATVMEMAMGMAVMEVEPEAATELGAHLATGVECYPAKSSTGELAE
jgi:hypothetical protein